ncbi:MAG TPA: serine hydrolase domain-containing protein [Candidatus Acidoferrum sp.]|nr:serine hydrolase domain-containing protein [Candidatus Acidoferrum sp.]
MRPAGLRLTVCQGIVTVLLLATIAGAQQKEELPHPKTLPELQKAMKDVVEKAHLPGAGVALVSNGELLWCGGFGKADIASGRDITCDTEFRVGSISKSFVALALLKLQEEGKINIEARLQDVAPEVPVKNRWESTNPVRIVNLLEHTAGFDDMQASEVYNFKDPYDFPLLDVFKRFQEPQEVRWPPSTRMSYSNPGFGIAGYLIEKTAGKPFDQYIRETILRPLGMANADFPFTDANKPLLAAPYDGDPPHALRGYPYIYLRPAGDLKASPGELAKLVQFLLRRGKTDDGQILKQESIIRMESVESTLAAKNGLRLGYGLANYTEVVGGVVTHGHDGGIDGFISTYRYMPEQNWGYVVLLNSTQSFQALLDLNRLAIDFLSKDFPKSQQPAVSVSAADLEKFADYYAPSAPRSQLFAFMDGLTGGLRIRVINGQLTNSSLFGKPKALIPVGKNFFRGEKDPEATAVFATDSAGQMVFSSQETEGFSYGERTSIAWTYARLALFVLSIVLMATSLLFAIVWILRKVFGGMKGVQHFAVRAVPLLATLSFCGLVFCFTKLGGADTGRFTHWTAGIFAFSLLFPLLSLYGLFLAVRVPKAEIHNCTRVHSLLVALACCVVTVFIASWHVIGLRLWAP